MKAILADAPGGPEQLKIGTAEPPVPGENELLIKVEATALNRADILQRKGKYPPPPGASKILGLEIAGTVVKTENKNSQWKPGDRVFGLLPGGGYAEYTVIHEQMALPIPVNLSFEQAAAIPEVFLTAFQALVWLGDVQKDQTILIHAGASGVGTAAIQIAKTKGAKIIITASKKKHRTCLDLGADAAIDYKKGPFIDAVKKFTTGNNVDLIVDFIGGPYFTQNIDCLRKDGRLIILASLGGGKVQELDMRQILRKRLRIEGSTLRSRTLEYQIKLTQHFAAFALPFFKNETMKPVIDQVYSWHNIQKAHEHMEANKNTGKIVLRID